MSSFIQLNRTHESQERRSFRPSDVEVRLASSRHSNVKRKRVDQCRSSLRLPFRRKVGLGRASGGPTTARRSDPIERTSTSAPLGQRRLTSPVVRQGRTAVGGRRARDTCPPLRRCRPARRARARRPRRCLNALCARSASKTLTSSSARANPTTSSASPAPGTPSRGNKAPR